MIDNFMSKKNNFLGTTITFSLILTTAVLEIIIRTIGFLWDKLLCHIWKKFWRKFGKNG